jgi:type IV pilus assembly protein PilM
MKNQKAAEKTDTSAPAGKSKTRISAKDIIFSWKRIFASTQNVIGIDIGSSYIKLLQLQKVHKGYVITNCVTRALPGNLKDNPAEKKKLLSGLIKEFIADSRIKTNLARVAISGKGVFIFSITVPSINKKDLRGLIGIELKKRLPYQVDINNITFDYFVTGQPQDEKGPSLQLTCIASDRASVDEQIEFLKEINIRPVAVNVTSDALGNLVANCLSLPPEKTVTLLDIGANTSLLNFYKGRNLIFSREIPVGGEHITQAMANKSIVTPSGTIEMIPEDAEKIKRNIGIPLEDEAKIEYLTDYGGIMGEQISTLLRPTLERLILEITRTISYYTKTFKGEQIIEELYITGGSSRLRNIDKFLLYNLDKLRKVERINALNAVKGWADTGVFKQELVMEQAAPHLAVAFGLCLGNGGKVNLLPAREKLEQKTIFISVLMKFFFPVIISMILTFYAFRFANTYKYKVLISQIDLEINRLHSTVSQIEKYLVIKTKLDERKEFLEKVKTKQPIWGGVLKELSIITPEDVVLQKLSVDQLAQPREIRISGKIIAKYTILDLAISQYIMVLEESPYFSDVKLISREKDMYSALPAASIEIACKLVY